MARYIKNPDGVVHSVPDDFDFPEAWDGKGQEITEDEALEASPALFGAPDPVIERLLAAKEPDADPVSDAAPEAPVAEGEAAA